MISQELLDIRTISPMLFSKVDQIYESACMTARLFLARMGARESAGASNVQVVP